MIGDALGYPLRGPSGRTGLLVLWVAVVAVAVGRSLAVAFAPSALALLPAAVTAIVLVLSLGYLSRVLVDGGTEPPVPRLRATVRDGVLALGPTVGLLAPPTGLLLMTVRALPGARASPVAGAGTLFLTGSTATLVLFLACTYLLPVTVATAVGDGRLRDSIDARTLLPTVSDPDYLTGWAVGFPLLVVAFGLGWAATGSADVEGLLSALVAAYLLLAGARAIGRGLASAGGPA